MLRKFAPSYMASWTAWRTRTDRPRRAKCGPSRILHRFGSVSVAAISSISPGISLANIGIGRGGKMRQDDILCVEVVGGVRMKEVVRLISRFKCAAQRTLRTGTYLNKEH